MSETGLVAFSSVELPVLSSELRLAEMTLVRAQALAEAGIQSPAECNQVEAVYAEAKKRAKALTEQRQSMTGDIKAGISKIEGFFRPYIKGWDAVAETCKEACAQYRAREVAENARKQAEAAQLAAQNAPVEQVHQALVASQTFTEAAAGVHYRKQTVATVQDLTALLHWLADRPEIAAGVLTISSIALVRLYNTGVEPPGVEYGVVQSVTKSRS